jgi:hypothetical protein
MRMNKIDIASRNGLREEVRSISQWQRNINNASCYSRELPIRRAGNRFASENVLLFAGFGVLL